ncbi:MAG: hypothetical protein JWO67_4227 [Streptosporangiaceae bacterium]|jgi:hypothetical protein|nr:hypothetical protein [Streptosporangiaceae bacterium]
MELTAQQVSHRLTELTAEFAGWRIGRGGSGVWWAVRGNELVRTVNVDELRTRLRELAAPQRRREDRGTRGRR